MLLLQGVDLQANELVQAHFQNGCCLPLSKMQALRQLFRAAGTEFDALGLTLDEALLCLLEVFAAPEDLDDHINDIHRLDEAFLHLPLFPLLAQQRLIFPTCQLELEFHMVTDHIF